MDENTTTLEEIRSIDNAKEASTDLVALNNTVRTEWVFLRCKVFKKKPGGGGGGGGKGAWCRGTTFSMTAKYDVFTQEKQKILLSFSVEFALFSIAAAPIQAIWVQLASIIPYKVQHMAF